MKKRTKIVLIGTTIMLLLAISGVVVYQKSVSNKTSEIVAENGTEKQNSYVIIDFNTER